MTVSECWVVLYLPVIFTQKVKSSASFDMDSLGVMSSFAAVNIFMNYYLTLRMYVHYSE